MSGFGFLSVLQLALVLARQLATGDPLSQMILALNSAASIKFLHTKKCSLRLQFFSSEQRVRCFIEHSDIYMSKW
ncbi:hypothetical protein PHACT_10160 [Pseudohongiella acticola]|uniref:Uncharacterized protein n=1 Tax=Pseudohongiella acticola TaxID=1524254 RepID=A0A1E8CM12_9GAMM|nr:hypothetical protein PHACT_10160 [Pseudohongiella acticola]